jgi:adenylyl-sulfate kinase
MSKTAFFWFTGLSGSGKTTVANGVKPELEAKGYTVFIIDGDEVRQNSNRRLGFSSEDIKENNAFIVEICEKNKVKFDVILVPIISPFKECRRKARERLGNNFYEIYFSAGLDCVVRRDVKGLYQKARQKVIKNMIGFSRDGVDYEVPENPDAIINTEEEPPEISVINFRDFVISKVPKSEARVRSF